MKNFRTLILSLLLVLSLVVAGCGLAPETPCYHEWGEWEVATSATCTVDGLKTRICSKCEEVESQVISSLGHDLQQYEAQAPTCTQVGWEAYESCSRCDYTTYKEKTPTSHIYSTEWVITDTHHYKEAICGCDLKKDYSNHEEDSSGFCSFCELPMSATEGLFIDASSDGTYAEVIGYSGSSTKVNIPLIYNNLPVKTIYDEAFKDTNITKVVIPASVTSIGNYAFDNCDSLTSVDFGENSQLTSIGNSAFKDCTRLASIEIPNSVTSIGEYAFEGCNSALYTTENSLKYVKANDNPYFLLMGVINKNFSTYVINSQTKLIDCEVFYGCTRLASIEIPASVTSIRSSAFKDCSSLTSIEIPDSVTSIGYSAFRGCSTLISIEIPDSVTSIGEYAFSDCDSLTIYCEEESKPSGWDSSWNYSKRPVVWNYGGQRGTTEDGIVWIALNNGITITSYSGNLTTIEIPATINGISVTSIGDSAFRDCDSLTSIEIPSIVTSIGYGAFYWCGSLTSVTFGENSRLTSIGDSAFDGCDSLTSVEIPDSVTSIGNSAFSWCDSLTSIEIPDSVTSIEYWAFYECDSLTSVDFGENGSLTSIGTRAFYSCDSLTSIEIPDSVTSIGYGAFSSCGRLTSVTFGENSQLTSTGEDVFYDCDSLTSIEIPSSVTSIGAGVFFSCSSLISIEIPSSVTSIGNGAFYGCSSLTSVTFGENSQLSSIGSSAFYNCNSLTSVTFGENSRLTSIGEEAFYECDSLTRIEVPSSVTSIGDLAFSGCASLTSIVIPASVTSIGYRAFSGCSSLTIYCEVESQPSGWESSWNLFNRPVYWKGEWEYVNGVPTPKN